MGTTHDMLQSPWARAWRRLWRQPMARGCLAVIAVYFGVALYGECQYHRYRMADQTPSYQRAAMDARYRPPSFLRHPFAAAEGTGWI